MKIRQPWIINWIGFLGAIFIRLWVGTLSYRYHARGARVVPPRKSSLRSCIYVFWHENFLLPCCLYGEKSVKVLISTHADGDMIAKVATRLGFGTVRGSSTRGAITALRQMLKNEGRSHLAILPDGPVGPRRHFEPGLVYLASKTGMPIILIGIGYARPWRLRTWDHFACPRPFSKAVVVSSDPIAIPPNLVKSEIEVHAKDLELRLNEISDEAERIATAW